MLFRYFLTSTHGDDSVIFCLTWTENANSLKQNIIVIKEICSWLLPVCKQNLNPTKVSAKKNIFL